MKNWLPFPWSAFYSSIKEFIYNTIHRNANLPDVGDGEKNDVGVVGSLKGENYSDCTYDLLKFNIVVMEQQWKW